MYNEYTIDFDNNNLHEDLRGMTATAMEIPPAGGYDEYSDLEDFYENILDLGDGHYIQDSYGFDRDLDYFEVKVRFGGKTMDKANKDAEALRPIVHKFLSVLTPEYVETLGALTADELVINCHETIELAQDGHPIAGAIVPDFGNRVSYVAIANDGNEMSRVLTHELIHVLQLASGRLGITRNGSSRTWDGVEMNVGYFDRPWEIQAYALDRQDNAFELFVKEHSISSPVDTEALKSIPGSIYFEEVYDEDDDQVYLYEILVISDGRKAYRVIH